VQETPEPLLLRYLTHTNGLPGGPYAVSLNPYAPAPHMNEPRRMLRFELSGDRSPKNGIEPGKLARLIRERFET
jgi:hypothetical protein